METEELIEMIKKMNAGACTTEEIEDLKQKREKIFQIADNILPKIKELVDERGFYDIDLSPNGPKLCEIEKIRGMYQVSFYVGTAELELIKTYRVSEFPTFKWFEDKWKIIMFHRITSIF